MPDISKRKLVLKNRIPEFLSSRSMSQSQLAELVGSSRNTICSICNGVFCPSAYLAFLICIALDCKFEELFYFEVPDLVDTAF